ncbi:hypothetical protein PsYK624_013460 [Phanerochaete sordida]|uniref:Uncharacterized protein n=1 Tax=Phanerochaete sordida TaxID=48140 RepID=A0A9P3FXZ7_9APHY|nr:hypothetical protein PsYK624_013460 [Phanerochaete sordida]
MREDSPARSVVVDVRAVQRDDSRRLQRDVGAHARVSWRGRRRSGAGRARSVVVDVRAVQRDDCRVRGSWRLLAWTTARRRATMAEPRQLLVQASLVTLTFLLVIQGVQTGAGGLHIAGVSLRGRNG